MQRFLIPLFLALAQGLNLCADDNLDQRFPVRGLSIAAPSASQVERFTQFIRQDLAPRGVNTLILRVDYNFQFDSHPELRDANALSRAQVKSIVQACQEHGIRIIPQINLLGHQSWASRLGNLLQIYPEFDETPWVKMPENTPGPTPTGSTAKAIARCIPRSTRSFSRWWTKSATPSRPTRFMPAWTRCSTSAKTNARAARARIRRSFSPARSTDPRSPRARRTASSGSGATACWTARLTGVGEWEGSLNDTHRAIDLIPKDVVICDWHYERAEPTAAYFALKGFSVVTCPWKNPRTAALQVEDMARLRAQPNAQVSGRAQGIVQTVWSGANSFMDNYQRYAERDPRPADEKSEAACFIRVFEEMARSAAP